MAEIALGADMLAFVLFVISRDRPRRMLIARALLGVAALSLAALLVVRSVSIGFPALTSTYEGLIAVALAINAFLAIASARLLGEGRVVAAAGAIVTFVLLAILSSPLVAAELHPPVPVLRSGWLVIHVALSFAGLALFTIAAVASAVGLRSPEVVAADRTRDQAIALGFVFYSIGGLVFGAIWAESAWGRFWGWDPKETWALVTTLVYAGYLHLRYVTKVSPRLARVLAIVAWLLACFTFLGVNALLSGLHSYA